MSNALVDRDVLHMYPRQEVEVRPGVLERIDHVVRYIRAGARLAINPSSPPGKRKSVRLERGRFMLAIVHALEPSLFPVCRSAIDHKQ